MTVEFNLLNTLTGRLILLSNTLLSPYNLDYAGGWVCFVVSIIAIGFLTAIIGDLASAFGCTVGLTDAVTSTTFVALGTSLPGKSVCSI